MPDGNPVDESLATFKDHSHINNVNDGGRQTVPHFAFGEPHNFVCRIPLFIARMVLL